MGPILLTVFAAGALGGGVAAGITVIVVLAAVALVLIAAYNGLRSLLYLCDATRARADQSSSSTIRAVSPEPSTRG